MKIYAMKLISRLVSNRTTFLLMLTAIAVLQFLTYCQPSDQETLSESQDAYISELVKTYPNFLNVTAHSETEFWKDSSILSEFAQSSCGNCHLSEVVEGAPLLTKGRLLIKEKGCSSCHEINDFYSDKNFGPELDGIGNKVRTEWLYHWINSTESYLEHPRMPSFRFDNDKLNDLIAFLLSLDNKNNPPHPIKALPSEAGDPDRGHVLVSESRCISCHSINGRGGTFAPELERVGDKVQESWLPNFFNNIHYYQPQKKMLAFNFTEQEALDIASYILEEYTEEDFELPDFALDFSKLSQKDLNPRIERGKQIFIGYGCRGCHKVGSIPESKVGPKLIDVGNRPVSTMFFGNRTDAQKNLHNWLFLKLKDPATYDSIYNMPSYNLSDKNALELTIALMGNKKGKYPDKYLVHEKQGSPFTTPQGEFGKLFEKYSCLSCHSIENYGGTISTVSLQYEGSKVKFEWLKNYLIKPYAVRPLLTARMPRFRMTKEEASIMANYIKTVFVSYDIPRFVDSDFIESDFSAGKDIFEERKCVSCHIKNKKGGYVGPALDKVGERLEPGWVYQWLRTPQDYRDSTIHPDYGFSQMEAKQLTAYLVRSKKK